MQSPKEKLQEIIDQGSVQLTEVLTGIQQEFETREDYIVRPSAIEYYLGESGVKIIFDKKYFDLTPHSINQLWQKTKIPGAYAKRLIGLGEKKLLLENLYTMTKRQNHDGILFREVNRAIKGILSPSYNRIDANPIFEAFISKALEAGFKPFRGRNTDYRYQISFIYPKVYEPSENEAVVYGMSLTTGDYGSQAMELNLMALRIVCANLAVGYDLFRRVHIGKRFDLGDREMFQLSERTNELDLKTVQSAIGDAVNCSINHIIEVNKIVEGAVLNEDVDVKKALGGLKKRGVSKDVIERINTTFEAELPIELLPQKKSAWKLSNAISLVAKSNDLSLDASVDLEKEAFNVLSN